jgi:hypothetical protein
MILVILLRCTPSLLSLSGLSFPPPLNSHEVLLDPCWSTNPLRELTQLKHLNMRISIPLNLKQMRNKKSPQTMIPNLRAQQPPVRVRRAKGLTRQRCPLKRRPSQIILSQPLKVLLREGTATNIFSELASSFSSDRRSLSAPRLTSTGTSGSTTAAATAAPTESDLKSSVGIESQVQQISVSSGTFPLTSFDRTLCSVVEGGDPKEGVDKKETSATSASTSSSSSMNNPCA